MVYADQTLNAARATCGRVNQGRLVHIRKARLYRVTFLLRRTDYSLYITRYATDLEQQIGIRVVYPFEIHFAQSQAANRV